MTCLSVVFVILNLRYMCFVFVMAVSVIHAASCVSVVGMSVVMWLLCLLRMLWHVCYVC